MSHFIQYCGCTEYAKKYAHDFCFAVLCCGYTLADFPISIRLTSLALWQSNDCPSASKATLMNMDKYFMWIHYERLHNHNKAKHNKTVCIFLGIYCMWWMRTFEQRYRYYQITFTSMGPGQKMAILSRLFSSLLYKSYAWYIYWHINHSVKTGSMKKSQNCFPVNQLNYPNRWWPRLLTHLCVIRGGLLIYINTSPSMDR